MTEDGKPPWKLTPEEWRTLMVTFVGGLASIVVGACVIGGAIALSRWFTHGLTSKERLSLLAPTVIAWGFTGFFVWDLTSKETKKLVEQGARRIYVIAAVLMILGSLFLLLVWIGVAVGIK